MRQTSAHSCSKFVTEFLLRFVIRYFLLMFCSSYRRTALHLASENGHSAACQLLISAEADVNATDLCAFMFVTEFLLRFFVRYCHLILRSSDHRTALHLAAENGHTAACQLLISAEADVNAKNRCAFMFVTEFLLRFFVRYFHLIFCPSDQRTALHLAAYYGHTAACQLLISAEADVKSKNKCAFMFKICY